MASNNESNKKCHNCNWRATGDCSEEIDGRRCGSWFPIGHTYHKSRQYHMVVRVGQKEYRIKCRKKARIK